MIKIKIFDGKGSVSYAEDSINQWLEENPNIQIIDIKFGTASTGTSLSIIHTVIYKTTVIEEINTML